MVDKKEYDVIIKVELHDDGDFIINNGNGIRQLVEFGDPLYFTISQQIEKQQVSIQVCEHDIKRLTKPVDGWTHS